MSGPLSEDRLDWWAQRVYDAMEYGFYTVEEESSTSYDKWVQDDTLIRTMRALQDEVVAALIAENPTPAIGKSKFRSVDAQLVAYRLRAKTAEARLCEVTTILAEDDQDEWDAAEKLDRVRDVIDRP